MLIKVKIKSLPVTLAENFTIEIPPTSTVEEAIQVVKDIVPEIKSLERFLYLVNDELVVFNKQVLKEGDVLTVFPPLMGG